MNNALSTTVNHFFKNLQGKIILVTSVIIFLLVSLFFVYDFTTERKELYEKLVIHMKENAFSIRSGIENTDDPEKVQKILLEFAENMEAHSDTENDENGHAFKIPPHEVHLVDRSRTIIASTKPELIGFFIDNALGHHETGLKKVLSGQTGEYVEQMEHMDVRVLGLSVPVRKDGIIIGAIHYAEPYRKFEKLIMVSFLRHSLFALVLTVILSLVINFSLSRLVTKPIKNLALAMDKIRMSKAGKEIEISADDEIGALARSFNQMSLALREREEEVQKYTTELEQMVDERTKKLKESQSHLIQTEKLASMGKLSGFIAHEINTPIGIIVSRIECILMDATGRGYPESLIKDIEILKKHSQRISAITNNILAFSRKSSVEFSATDINKVIKDVLLFLEKQFSSQNVYFRKVLNNNIPAIEGNANQLRQVLFNVLNNAKDSMPEGGEIIIKTQHAGDRKIKVLIIDSGVGIPEINLDKIFDPFFTTKEEGKGTGLGLSVVYGIIKDHNGEINIESKRGKGTTFEIQLPVNENHSLEA